MCKTGLVLEGGAMRGLFTAGVIDVMMENGIEYDGMIGVSAGAVFGCNYKSGQIGRVIRYNKRFCKDPRYVGFRSWLKTGDLYGGEFDYHILPDKLDIMDAVTFKNNPMKFYVVATDVQTGKPFYKKIDEVNYEGLEWMRASASMPVASRPVELEGQKYLDGGISDSVPLKWMQENGYSKNVVVLTQPDGYVKKPLKYFGFTKLLLRKYPAIVNALRDRHRRYNRQLAFIGNQEKRGRCYVIRPEEELDIGAVCRNPEKLQEVYEKGRKTAENNLENIKSFLD